MYQSGCRWVRRWTSWRCPGCSRSGFTPPSFAKSFCPSGPHLMYHQIWFLIRCSFRAFFPEEKKLLSDVNIFVGEAGGGVGDLGKEDRESLWATITFHGGKVASSLQDPGISHLIVALPLGPSYNQGLTMESLQVVAPDWVMDSVRAGKRCDEVLYHPRLLKIPEKPAPNLPKPNKSRPVRTVTDQLRSCGLEANHY